MEPAGAANTRFLLGWQCIVEPYRPQRGIVANSKSYAVTIVLLNDLALISKKAEILDADTVELLPHVAAVRKDRARLLALLNAALEKLEKSGQLEKLKRKWMKKNGSPKK